MSHVVIPEAADAVDYDPFAGAEIARVVPTTEPQREVWLADQLGREASLAYNESVSLRMLGTLDARALQSALDAIVARHEALRATVSADGLQLLIAAPRGVSFAHVDHSALDAKARASALQSLRASAVETPFDLGEGPLFRATLVRVAPDEHELILTAHHIVCDGWSYGVVAPELMALYESARAGSAGTLNLPAAAGFGDYALAQADPGRGQAAEEDANWWVRQFADAIPVLELPTDRPRRGQRGFASRRVDLTLEPALVDAVRKMGARHGASLFATLFTVYGALLARLAGQSDVVVGVPAAGQAADGLQSLVGHCVRLLPIRVHADLDAPFPEFLAATRGTVLDAYEHQSCTFGTLLKRLQVARDPSRLPLVSVLFNLDSAIDGATLSRGGLAVSLASNARHFETFDLFLNASQADGRIVLECQYNLELFEAATVQRWLELYREALARLAADPARSAAEALAPTAGDVALLERFNRSAADYPLERIEAQVARQAAATPQAVAVVAQGRSLTYGELDRRANALGAELRRRGAGEGQYVGLYCGRNEHMFVALLGILKSGAGYIPMDPAFPADRLDFMSTDAGARFIVTDRSVPGEWKFRAAEPIVLDGLGESDVAPPPQGSIDNPAFVIYTSGSTGRPKGVRIAHRSMANLLASVRREPGMQARNTVLAVTTLSFDIATSEVILPLTVGARIVIADRAQATDGDALRALIESSGVDFIDATPSTWRLLIAAGWQGGRNLKAICTGEPLPPDLGRELLARVGELWNGYGPTETTVWSSFHRVTAIDGVVPIGHPIANTQIHVVDGQLRRMPVGAVGELFIAGDGVTLGYLGRPDLTEEKFHRDPFRAEPGARGYRTGDLGRWRADGVLECLGRGDSQVKLRGYRIELGEIEATLANHPGIERAVVTKREDRAGDPRLVAYCVPRGAPLSGDEVRDFLRRALPEYMIPQHVVALERLPLLPNGKLDRKSLPAPEPAARTAADRVAPANDLERAVLACMEEVLALPGMGMTDDFFMLGGHSLLAAQLTARLNKSFGTHLTMRTVFTAPTAAGLAAAVEADRTGAQPAARKPLARLADRSVAPASVAQERLWFLEELNPGRVTYNSPSAHRLLGAMDEAAFERAFREMVRRQPALRTSFEQSGGAVVQRIHELVPAALFPAEDLSALAPAEREARLAARLQELTAETFDLTRAPLYKARLFRLGPEEHAFFFMPHHIVWDGWSFDLFYEEMSALYGAYAAGKEPTLPELAFTYGDFAAWHRDWIEGPEYERQLAFWRERLEKLGAVRDLPSDKPRRPGMSGAGNTEWMSVDKARGDALHALGRRAGTTVFVAALAIYALLLHGYSGQRTLVIGTPVRGRNTLELERIMGFFNNLVPLQVEVEPAERFGAFVERVKARVVEGFAYPDVPLEVMATELATAGGTRGGTLLYQALFSFQDARRRDKRWGGLRHQFIPLFQKGATEDLGMWFLEGIDGLEGGVTYNTDILEPATAKALRAGYMALIDAVLAEPDAPLGALIEKAAIRRASPRAEAEPARPARAAHGPAPETATEKLLASLWCEALKLPSVSTQDNFFDLGGHSLLAMQAILEMESRTGKRVERSRFIFESLGQISRAYDEAKPEEGRKAGGLRGLLGGLLGGKRP